MNNIELFCSHDLQSIPVSVFNTDYKLSQEEKDKIRCLDYEVLEGRPVGVSFNYNILDSHDLKGISDVFNNCASRYMEEVLGLNIKIKSIGSWATRNTPGSFHHKHQHPNTLLSAVMYFKDSVDNDNLISNLVFHNNGLDNIFSNFKGFGYNKHVKEWNIYNNYTYSIKPTEGQIIVFPGHLFHHSDENISGTRYCIGSNYFIDDTLGTPHGKDWIKVNC